MSHRPVFRAIALISVAAALNGCASTGGVSGKQVLGAALGGVAGAGLCLVLTRNPATCALAGVAGALAGWGTAAIAENYARQQRSFEAEQAEFGYNPAQGTRIEMRGMQASPQTVVPGQSLDVTTQYALLAPDAERPVTVTEAISVWKDGSEVLAIPAKTVQRVRGGWEVSGRFEVPKKAPPGIYQVKQQVSAGDSTRALLAPFVVAAN